MRNNQIFKDLPNDPFMLFSFINAKLRDFYPDLQSLCNDLQLDENDLKTKLAEAGFEYSTEHNKFW
jgi:hypothetical protein